MCLIEILMVLCLGFFYNFIILSSQDLFCMYQVYGIMEFFVWQVPCACGIFIESK